MLTIFGYSAPRTDAAAMEILAAAWNENETRSLAEGQWGDADDIIR